MSCPLAGACKCWQCVFAVSKAFEAKENIETDKNTPGRHSTRAPDEQAVTSARKKHTQRIPSCQVSFEELRLNRTKLSKAPVGQACRQYAIGEMLLTARLRAKITMAAVPATAGRYASNGSKSTNEMCTSKTVMRRQRMKSIHGSHCKRLTDWRDTLAEARDCASLTVR